MKMNNDNYGECECGAPLIPVWFIEKQREYKNGDMVLTGKKRRACSHLTCEYCGKNYPVDDTFDGEWY